MDLLSTYQWSDEYSIHLSRRNKPVHFGGSLDFVYCIHVLHKVYNWVFAKYVKDFVFGKALNISAIKQKHTCSIGH